MSYEIARPGLNGLGTVDLSQNPPECAGQENVDPEQWSDACKAAVMAQLAGFVQGAEQAGWTKTPKPAAMVPAGIRVSNTPLARTLQLGPPEYKPSYETSDVPSCAGLPPEYRGNCLLPTGQAIPSCNGSLMPCWSTLSNKVLNTPEAGSNGQLPPAPQPNIHGTIRPVQPVQIDGATGCAAGGLLGAMGGGLLLGVPLALGAALLGAVLSDSEGAWWKWGGLTFVGATVLSGIAGCAGGVNAVDDAYKTGRLPAGA